jgi:hypothetical protein
MSTSFVRRAAACTFAGLLFILVGCISTPSLRSGHAALTQKGEVAVAGGAEVDVFFPKAYTGQPELAVEDDFLNNLKVVECKADHFRILNNSFQIVHVSWTATGEQGSPPPAGTKLAPKITVDHSAQ